VSELRANTISDAAGTGPVTLTKQSAAKAWCRTTGTGTPVISVSFNVSSLTDNGVGDQTFTYTSSFSATPATPANPQSSVFAAGAAQVLAASTSSVQLKTHDSAGLSTDDEGKHMVSNGDLA
jgi:hypothetical protein